MSAQKNTVEVIDGQVYRPTEVCQYLKISRPTLYRLERDKKLVPTRALGKTPLYLGRDILAFLEGGK